MFERVDQEIIADQLAAAPRHCQVDDSVTLDIGAGTTSPIQTAGPPLNGLTAKQDRLKRAFDLAAGSVLLIGLAPLMLLIAISVRTESRGPAIFRQVRMGRSGTPFTILKFRTMYHHLRDPDGDLSTRQADARVTTVGRILRKTSLDELPQLLNVLAGNMSLVGPRPHSLGSRIDGRLFREICPDYLDRYAVRPGMTGLAQINGRRGSIGSIEELRARVNDDLAYCRQWSFWADVSILFRSFGITAHRNAY